MTVSLKNSSIFPLQALSDESYEADARGKKGAELLIAAQSFSYSLKFEFDPNHPQTLRGSFSAGSTATIATKYSFFQVFRDLQDFHTFAPLRSQNFSEKPSKLLLEIFSFFSRFSMNKPRAARRRKAPHRARGFWGDM